MGTNLELGELHKNLDIAADVKKKRFEWNEHLVRMDEGRTDKKGFESEPE
jgi:hypothetical protein